MLERTGNKTLTIITHVQKRYDVTGVSAQACRKIIDSGLAGKIAEHRVAGAEPWLSDYPGFMNRHKETETDFETTYTVPRQAADRFILCGGSLRLPQKGLSSGQRVMERYDHYYAFTNLVRSLGDFGGRPKEFHLSLDATYSLRYRAGGETEAFNPPPEGRSLQNYFAYFSEYRISFRLFLGRRVCCGDSDPQVNLFFWPTADEMLYYLQSQK